MEAHTSWYSIGWIAPLPLELTAARAVLDDDHGDIHVDGYIYHGGRIRDHNVVMAVQPRMGTDAASDLAARMRTAFKNIEHFMVVGIGGGVPSYGPSGARSQVVLGDVVVSYPTGNHGGVVRYDSGGWTQGHGHRFWGHTNSPPDTLLNAVKALQARHLMRCGTKIPAFLREMRQNVLLEERGKFEDQGSTQDRLFQPDYPHPEESANNDCETCCNPVRSQLRQDRGAGATRQQDTPKIHYGNIASSNQLQLSAPKRDELHRDLEVICFEMEGAGAIQKHPCLVIRGICDYSDSHKNKRWQPYAAATAATYTKELLEVMPASESTRIFSVVQPASEMVQSIQDRRDCLHSLAFIDMNRRESEIEQETPKTCTWLSSHEKYKEWLDQPKGLLWIKGNPGVGKSTLMKYALCESKSKALSNDQLLVASFFFHGRGSSLQKSSLGLFRSLLHQILVQIPELLDQFTSIFKQRCDTTGPYGAKWEWHQNELQTFLQEYISSISQKRPITLYVDALDECGESVARDLVKCFQRLLSELDPSGPAILHICFSCRHYPIISLDHGLIIRVEEENHADIAQHVHSELEQIRLSEGDTQTLEEMVVEHASGVFQWIVLVLPKLLALYYEGRSTDEVLAKIREIPKELDELYRGILMKTKAEYRLETLHLMQWICFAQRPLTISELRCALAEAADVDAETIHEGRNLTKHATTDDQMEKRVKSLSGGLVEVIGTEERTPQFIHQSVRDFLVGGAIQMLYDSLDHHFVGLAHFHLSRSCIRHIKNTIARSSALQIQNDITIFDPQSLMQYAMGNWVEHAKKVEEEGIPQIDLLGLFEWPSNEIIQTWMDIYRTARSQIVRSQTSDSSKRRRVPHSPLKGLVLGATLLHFGCVHGLVSLVKGILLKANIEIDPVDSNNRTPLSHAAEQGQEAIVQLLLKKGAHIEYPDSRGRTPLSHAARQGREAVVHLLLKKGAHRESTDSEGCTPLSHAVDGRAEAVVHLLLEKGAHIDSRDSKGRTPLSHAVGRGAIAFVHLLLEKGAHIDSRDSEGHTPLSHAAKTWHEAAVKLLLERGAHIESIDSKGRTPLSHAVEQGFEAVVRLLLKEGAYTESKDSSGRTPLSQAATRGNDGLVKLLIDGGADMHSKDDSNQTPLLRASEYGRTKTIRLLLENGEEDIDVEDNYKRTPLSVAAEGGHEDAVELLLQKGATMKIEDPEYGRTQLLEASSKGKGAIVRILLEHGVDTEVEDSEGRTPLLLAAVTGQSAIAKMLLDAGAKKEVKDSQGRTPLDWALDNGHKEIMRRLIGARASPVSVASSGKTLELPPSVKAFVEIRKIMERRRKLR